MCIHRNINTYIAAATRYTFLTLGLYFLRATAMLLSSEFIMRLVCPLAWKKVNYVLETYRSSTVVVVVGVFTMYSKRCLNVVFIMVYDCF